MHFTPQELDSNCIQCCDCFFKASRGVCCRVRPASCCGNLANVFARLSMKATRWANNSGPD